MLHLYLVVACFVQLVDVDMKALRTKRFRTVAQINPYGKVPALQDGNLTLVRCSSCGPFD
jgi:glutathione S-transferase